MKSLLLLLAATLSLGACVSAAESRLALVMGVSTYDTGRFTSLPGIKIDLEVMATALRRVGFDVTVVPDPSLVEAEEAIDAFGTKLAVQKGVGLFYFSGHGGEYEGKNYLIPRASRIKDIRDIKEQAVAANRVLNRMEASGSRVNIVFLDCCRNDLTKAATDSGMAAMSARGTFIGYATASDKGAAASLVGSPYTQILAKNITTPGLSILDMHTQVTAQVQDATKEDGQEQTPFSYSGLRSAFFFVEPGGNAPASVAPQVAVATTPAPPAPTMARPPLAAEPAPAPVTQSSSGGAVQIKGATPEVWTDSNGRILEATLVEVSGDKVTLRIPKGSVYTLSLDKFRADSQARIRHLEALNR